MISNSFPCAIALLYVSHITVREAWTAESGIFAKNGAVFWTNPSHAPLLATPDEKTVAETVKLLASKGVSYQPSAGKEHEPHNRTACTYHRR